jgi:hypothetical protein
VAFSIIGQEERREYFAQGEKNQNLWIACMSPDVKAVQQAIVDSARKYLNSLYSQTRANHSILGFKEVRYGGPELELLRHCYPNASFLLVIRNPLNVWRSTKHFAYHSIGQWIEEYNAGFAYYRDCAKADPRCHLIRYEDMIRQEEETMTLISDVAKVSTRQIASVLSHKVGSSVWGVTLDKADEVVVCERCRDIMEEFGYV